MSALVLSDNRLHRLARRLFDSGATYRHVRHYFDLSAFTKEEARGVLVDAISFDDYLELLSTLSSDEKRWLVRRVLDDGARPVVKRWAFFQDTLKPQEFGRMYETMELKALGIEMDRFERICTAFYAPHWQLSGLPPNNRPPHARCFVAPSRKRKRGNRNSANLTSMPGTLTADGRDSSKHDIDCNVKHIPQAPQHLIESVPVLSEITNWMSTKPVSEAAAASEARKRGKAESGKGRSRQRRERRKRQRLAESTQPHIASSQYRPREHVVSAVPQDVPGPNHVQLEHDRTAEHKAMSPCRSITSSPRLSEIADVELPDLPALHSPTPDVSIKAPGQVLPTHDANIESIALLADKKPRADSLDPTATESIQRIGPPNLDVLLLGSLKFESPDAFKPKSQHDLEITQPLATPPIVSESPRPGIEASVPTYTSGPSTPIIEIERVPATELGSYQKGTLHLDTTDGSTQSQQTADGDPTQKSPTENRDAPSSPLTELSASPSPPENFGPPTDELPDIDSSDQGDKKRRKRKQSRKKSDHFEQEPPKKKKRRVPAGTSTMTFPPITAPGFGLVQEKLHREPFNMLVAVLFLNKTAGRCAMPIYRQLMETYPSPRLLAEAKISDVSAIIHRLGLQNQRAKKLIRFAQVWLDTAPEVGKRYRTKDYPLKGDHQGLKPDEILPDASDCAGALEIAHLPGLGPYAWDSWRIYCRDIFRGVADGFNGEHADSEDFEPEWKRVVPLDKELRAALRWMWLREGYIWNPITGTKEVADKDTMERARTEQTDWEIPDVKDEKETDAAAVERGAEAMTEATNNAGSTLEELDGSRPAQRKKSKRKGRAAAATRSGSTEPAAASADGSGKRIAKSRAGKRTTARPRERPRKVKMEEADVTASSAVQGDDAEPDGTDSDYVD